MQASVPIIHMFSEQTFAVKHPDVTGPREADIVHEQVFELVGEPAAPLRGEAVARAVQQRCCSAASPDVRAARLPQAVYRRRRLAVALVAAAVMVPALMLGRPERVPYGEVEAWPVPTVSESAGSASR